MAADWEKLLKFRCTGCGNCCRGTYILITDSDLARLVEGTGRSANEIVHFVGEKDVAFDKRHPWWIRFEAGRRVMVLRWKRGACTFLDADNRCTAYEHRPLVCRIHPFNVTLTDEDRGGIAKLALSRLVPCPHEWDGHESKRTLGALERQLWRESDIYIAKVRALNRGSMRPRTATDVLRQLRPEFAAEPLDRRHTTA
jgi:Fe-S-cluster containining protein